MSNTDGSDLVEDITKLALNDNFYTWFTTTNQIIDAINPLNIYDITPRKGLNESRSGGNVILDVHTGKGIKAYPNDAIGGLTLDIETLTTETSVSNIDYFLIEKPGTEPSNDLFKVVASNILPPTINSDHEFLGTITVNALNVRDNAIRLQYGDTTTENDSGLILDTTTSSKVKFTYNTTKSAWFSNRNIGLQDGYAFLTNGTGRRAEFKYTTSGSTQYDVAIEMFMGIDSTNNDDKSWIIEARNVDRTLNFIYKDYTNTDTETRIFYATVESTGSVTSTFAITDKISIGNVSGSVNFKNDTSLTTLGRSAYEANRIPISNSDGILDNKWTNRYVTTQHSGVAVGNIVKLYDDTNNQATVVKSELTSSSSEEEAYSLGIVERLSGGKAYVVTHGQFDGLSGLLPGSVYYLTTGSPNYTTTKPTSGIVKPVFIATSTTGGIFFPMSAQGLSFGRATVSAGAGGTASGSAPVADAPTDTLNFVAGAGINLVANPASTSIQISAATAGNQPTYSSIATDSGTVAAFQPSETLLITGDSGGIEVIADNKVDTNGDKLTIKGRYFRTVSWSGDSSTNDIPGSKTASYDDTLSIFAGTGIGISQHGSGFRIDATGVAASSILPNSQPLSILFNSASTDSDSIIGYFAPHPSQARRLSSTTNSILSSSTSNAIEWQTPTTFISQKLASSTNETSKFSMSTGLTAGLNRHFGIAVLSKTTTALNKLTNHNFPAFTFTSLNNINGAVIGLKEGDGIKLNVYNSTSSALDNALPIITIKNNYPMGIGKININDTGEIITSAGTQTDYVNLVRSSPDLSQSAGGGFVYWTAYNPVAQDNSSTTTQTSTFPGRSPNTSKTFTESSRLGGTISNNLGTRINFAPTSANNGIFSSLMKENGGSGDLYYTEELQGKTITISVWAVSNTAGSQTFRLSYYPGRMAGYAGGTSTFSSIQTATTTPQRFTFTVNVTSVTNTTVQSGTHPLPPNIAISNDGVDTTGQDIIFWGAQVEFASSYSGKLLPTNNGSASLYTETNNSVNFDTTNSPISIDGDTSSNTIYFNIAANSINNNYLATMADNTVKVGTGSTNANNTPQDLAIGTNSVLGRVGNGDLKSVNMTELTAMLGTTQFLQVQTDDSGTLLPSESTTIRLKGGAGIVTSIGTNNEIIITNTGGGGGGGIGAVSTSGGGLITGSFTKLTFNDQDFKYTLSTADSGATAVISSGLNWGSISGGSASAGPGLIFGSGVKNANNSSLQTKLSQVGNGKQNSQLPFISVPSDGSTQSSLSYIGRENTGQTTAIDRVVGFDSSGNLVATNNFISGISFSGVSGLSFSSGTITATSPVRFPSVGTTDGKYRFENENAQIIGSFDGTRSFGNFAFFANQTPNASTWGSFVSGSSTRPYVTKFVLGSYASIPTAAEATTAIHTRTFGSNGLWSRISSASGSSDILPRICLPSDGFFVGSGPDSSGATDSVGTYIRNSDAGQPGPGIVLTNYNLNASGSKVINRDRSCRIGFEILDVDSVSSNAYPSSRNTAFITHTLIPRAVAGTTVDQFTLPSTGLASRRSYKYLVHAENSSGDFYTTELLVQVKGTTTNLVQYASSSTSASLVISFSVSATSDGTNTTVTISHNNTSGTLDIKLLRYEV